MRVMTGMTKNERETRVKDQAKESSRACKGLALAMQYQCGNYWLQATASNQWAFLKWGLRHIFFKIFCFVEQRFFF